MKWHPNSWQFSRPKKLRVWRYYCNWLSKACNNIKEIVWNYKLSIVESVAKIYNLESSCLNTIFTGKIYKQIEN